jgi:xanthine dehydrogenase YagS FAD-binding subunit
MNSFTWVEVGTAEQAVAQLAAARGGPSLLKAGGVDVLDRLKEGLDAPARLVVLRRTPKSSLAEIAEVAAANLPETITRLLPAGNAGEAPKPRDCLRIGTLVTLAQLAEHPTVVRALPALAQAAAHIATPQIRALATLGGNLLQRPRCWYFRSADYTCRKKGGDECFALDGENENHAIFDNRQCAAVHPSGAAVALSVLDAIVEIQTPSGSRQGRLSAFFLSPSAQGGDVKRENRLEPGEVITHIYIPIPAADERNTYLKIKQKQSFDWPLVEVAVAVKLAPTGTGPLCSVARIALGGVAPVPWRAKAAEAALLRLQKVDADSLREVGRAASEGARPLAKNAHKVPLCQGAVQQAVYQVLQPASARGDR